jgi:hypothetical protein
MTTATTVPNPISPESTEFSNKLSRVRIRRNRHSNNLKELKAKQSAGHNSVLDRDARMEMVLSEKDFQGDSDIAAQIATEMLNFEATVEAEQSLIPQLAKARYEAATTVLAGLKKPHDEIVDRLLAGIVDAFIPAYIELFQLSRDLKDKDCGWRNGVCDLVPKLVDLFGPPSPNSPLASLLHEAVRCGYLKANDLPRQYRAS